MSAAPNATVRQRKTLAAACLAHALHDGYTDMIYVLLPVWQTEFVLGYGLLALLRGLYAGTMATLQVGAVALSRRLGGRLVLALGTLAAAAGYGIAGCSGGLLGLCAALCLSGAGSSVQHPLAAAAVSRAFGPQARGPLGVYNFGGDLGKATLPAGVAILLTLFPWRQSLWLVGGLGVVAALGIWGLLANSNATPEPASQRPHDSSGAGSGFGLLFAIGVLDTATRMGFLTFLPFILKGKGAGMPEIGLGLAMVFMGGACGKFLCGWLGERFGLLAVVLATEGGTTACILLVVGLPLVPCLLILPVLGLMLNGTSTVLYGTVPELTPRDQVERAFALFYTGTIGAGALAPVLYGVLGDRTTPVIATLVTALTALLTLPLAFLLAQRLPTRDRNLPA